MINSILQMREVGQEVYPVHTDNKKQTGVMFKLFGSQD